MKVQEKTTRKKAVQSKTVKTKSPARASKTSASPSTEERHRRIAEAAYYIAERRGFQDGSAHGDWLQAEKIIDG